MPAVGDGTAFQRGDGSILPMRLRNLAGVLPDRAASRFMVFFRLDANHPVRIPLKVIVKRGGL
jgi:hypothetical protein